MSSVAVWAHVKCLPAEIDRGVGEGRRVQTYQAAMPFGLKKKRHQQQQKRASAPTAAAAVAAAVATDIKALALDPKARHRSLLPQGLQCWGELEVRRRKPGCVVALCRVGRAGRVDVSAEYAVLVGDRPMVNAAVNTSGERLVTLSIACRHLKILPSTMYSPSVVAYWSAGSPGHRPRPGPHLFKTMGHGSVGIPTSKTSRLAWGSASCGSNSVK